MCGGLSFAIADLHSPVKVTLYEALHALAGGGEQGAELFQLRGGEGGEDPVLHVVVGVGLFAYAEADAGEGVGAQLVDDAAKTPLAAVRALSADTHTAHVQGHVIGADDDALGRDLVEAATAAPEAFM